MRRMLIGLTAVAVVVGAGVLVLAQPGSMGDRHGPGFPGVSNLTDAQRTEVRKIFDEHRDTQQATMKALHDLRAQLTAEIFTDAPNTGKIEELKAQIAAADAEALASRVDLQLKLASVLTPEQRAQVRDRRTREPMMGRGPGRGGMRGMGRP